MICFSPMVTALLDSGLGFTKRLIVALIELGLYIQCLQFQGGFYDSAFVMTIAYICKCDSYILIASYSIKQTWTHNKLYFPDPVVETAKNMYSQRNYFCVFCLSFNAYFLMISQKIPYMKFHLSNAFLFQKLKPTNVLYYVCTSWILVAILNCPRVPNLHPSYFI